MSVAAWCLAALALAFVGALVVIGVTNRLTLRKRRRLAQEAHARWVAYLRSRRTGR